MSVHVYTYYIYLFLHMYICMYVCVCINVCTCVYSIYLCVQLWLPCIWHYVLVAGWQTSSASRGDGPWEWSLQIILWHHCVLGRRVRWRESDKNYSYLWREESREESQCTRFVGGMRRSVLWHCIFLMQYIASSPNHLFAWVDLSEVGCIARYYCYFHTHN